MHELLSEVVDYLHAGGPVMVPLVVLGLVLWYLMGLRMVALRRGAAGPVPVWYDEASRHTAPCGGVLGRALRRGAAAVAASGPDAADELDEVLLEEEHGLSRFGRPIRVITSAAPLLGLLGTVGGMIETFRSLVYMSLFTQSGGVAGGISQALITTQLGLLIAIPGLLASRLLDQREHALHKDLAQLKKMLLLRARSTGAEVDR